MGEPSLKAFLAPLADKPWLKVDARPGCAVQIDGDELRWRLNKLVEDATARTLELVAEWLRAEALAVRESGAITGPEWCDALRSAAMRVESGAFAAWLKERETRGS